MKVPELIYSTLANRCPRCHNGKVFEINNPYRLAKAFKMHEECSECNLKYEREPGFFYGALYVSYALMSGVFILWFIADLLWLHLDAVKLTSLVVGSMIVLFPVAFRWARLIWINFFVRYDKKYKQLKQNSSLHDKHIHA